MTFQTGCMLVALLAYVGAAAGYVYDGKLAMGACMVFYAASIVCLIVVGEK